ncbi:MAG: prepilin-type N-terminal cleavage/methylation domain-containing protein [Elusimicrobiaceae bacterium]|nr:prepilin-type N-terminal cleavage/methylation domain-containing protein [Elusimicrobiaceae bacterium]
MKPNHQAFTLIELLVVVLIIGILAAVALPQYQKAVVKSRIATVLPIGKALAQAQYAYFIANGTYTQSVHDLDISLAGKCIDLQDVNGNVESYNDDEEGKYWSCDNYWMIDSSTNQVTISYCPGYNQETPAVCRDHRDFSIGFFYPSYPTEASTGAKQKAGKITCGNSNTSLGKSICNSWSL